MCKSKDQAMCHHILAELMKEYIILIKNNLFLFKGNTKKTFVFSYIIILRNRVSFLLFAEIEFFKASIQAKLYIYPKYSKHWLPSTWHTQLFRYVCSKILNHGLNHGLLFSLFWVKKHSKLTWKFRITGNKV